MKKQFQLTGIALLLSGVVLSGCAPKQAWSPELEQAREAYQRAAGNPLVNSLAVAELDQANRQLQAAEEAADYFKSREEIAHQATLAQLRSMEAEETARALQAKEHVRLAQAGIAIPAALPDATTGVIAEPILAAGTPQHNPHVGPAQQPEAMMKDPGFSGKSMSGGSSTELEQIASQLAALSAQIESLQNRSAYNAIQHGTQSSNSHSDHHATGVEDLVNNAAEVVLEESAITSEPLSTEPTLAAARPAQETDNSSSVYPEAVNDAVDFNAPNVAANARLRAELRAMNARPSSRGMALTLGERYFDSGSARLWNGRAARHLDNVAAVMVENPGLILEVEAHTDNTGTDVQKDNLSSDRAIAIRSALVLRGVDASRINSTGFADSSPIADNSTALGRLQNRRVEIIFPNINSL